MVKNLKSQFAIAFAQSRPQRQTLFTDLIWTPDGIIILRAIAKRKAISANNLSSVFRAKNTKRWSGERRQKAKSMYPCATIHHKTQAY